MCVCVCVCVRARLCPQVYLHGKRGPFVPPPQAAPLGFKRTSGTMSMSALPIGGSSGAHAATSDGDTSDSEGEREHKKAKRDDDDSVR